MEQDHVATKPGEVVELRGGRIWELTTESGERVVVDRGFRASGGSIRDHWRIEHGGAWQRLFWVGPVDVEPAESHDGKRRLPVAIGARVEFRTGFRDAWRTETALVAVRELDSDASAGFNPTDPEEVRR